MGGYLPLVSGVEILVLPYHLECEVSPPVSSYPLKNFLILGIILLV